MSGEIRLKLDPERIEEMPMVDLAFEILKTANEPMYYRDLIQEIGRIRGFSEEKINEVIAQIYTEINIDGRFACVGSNVWGLKRWYPVDRSEDPSLGASRPRIINDDDEEEEDLYGDEEEAYVTDEEDYDLYDEDGEELFDDADDEADVDEEVPIDDEELDEPDIEVDDELETEDEEEFEDDAEDLEAEDDL
ncbi:MAG: DNA-directed RNA polymerase subunit delta [Paenibacillaceae bacterium]|nr:MAG: DNA-directed RNA polymerase subunit delta [Paenibacillaceae bacterium]